MRSGMETWIADDYDSMSWKAADIIAETLYSNPTSVLCFPTGSTPEGMYKNLIELYHNGKIDFSDATIFHLDEYYCIAPDNPKSYCRYMREKFLNHVNVPKENIHLLDGNFHNVENYCKDTESRIEEAGGFDLCVLGIGSDGHIAFNMPGSSFGSRTRITIPSEAARQANSRFFDDKPDLVPDYTITLGTGTIMEYSKRIMLLANGEKKADSVAAALEGPVTEEVPASILQKHENALFLIDKMAASKLSHGFLRNYRISSD